jgi:hypothetical protein
MQSIGKDASGNELLLDVGLWLSQKINVRLWYYTYISHLLFTSSGSALHQMMLLLMLYACLCFTVICNISSCLINVVFVNSGIFQEK